jgi:hypothetical protein
LAQVEHCGSKKDAAVKKLKQVSEQGLQITYEILINLIVLIYV